MALISGKGDLPLKKAPVAPAAPKAAVPKKASEGRVIASPDVVEPIQKFTTKVGKTTLTAGRAHGVVSGIGNAVSYALHDAEAQPNGGSRDLNQAHGHVSLAFDHLAMHHALHSGGHYDEAAASLGSAANEINKAITRGSLGKKQSISHAGTSYNVNDLKATLDAHVNVYKNKMATNVPAESPKPKRYELPDRDTEEKEQNKEFRSRSQPKYGAGPTLQKEDYIPSTPRVISMPENHLNTVSKALETGKKGYTSTWENKKQAPSSEDTQQYKDTHKLNMHNAVLSLGKRKNIPGHVLSQLSDRHVDQAYDIVDKYRSSGTLDKKLIEHQQAADSLSKSLNARG